MRRQLVFLSLAYATLAAHATSTEEVDVTCPVCDGRFKAEKCNSSNGFGGQDRDFLQHARGGEAWIICLWTCPGCCYTGFRDDFDPTKAAKELVAKLMKENTLKPAEPVDPKLGDSRKIPPWIRSDLRIQVLKLKVETTAEELANACLRTAQTQRFEWDGFEGTDLAKRVNALLKEKWDAIPEKKRNKYENNPYDVEMSIAGTLEAEAADAKSALDGEGRLDARVAAAILYKMRGEDGDALRVLASLPAAGLPAEHKVVVEDIRVRIERERKYRQLAIPYFEKHLAEGKPEAQEAISIQYLVGVLYNRTGEPKRALAALEPLLAREGIPEGFLEWIKDEIAKAKAG